MEEKDQVKTEDVQNADNPITSPEETLLGSVTNLTNPEGSESRGQQIRSSARVFKKMKLDLTISAIPEKTEKKEDSKQDTKKCYRPLWTSDDKTMFFEALNEYGKDFESIQMYISSKLRKKGVPDNLIKTKDHVRNFYYRTWHKISKYLKFAEGIKKVTQELYGLINYGELRKKIGSVSEKALLKLNELIYRGITILRVKGKNIRVKTPMCKALRRLNQLDEKYDEIKLPNRIIVVVRPKDMSSYLQVQCMAQNPRIKTIVPLQIRLSSLFTTLNNKWKSVDAKFYDKALVSISPITNDCIPPLKISENTKMILNPLLRLTPPENCNIEIPSINLSEYFTRQTICLNSYQHRVGITTSEYGAYNYSIFKVLNKSSAKKGSNRPRADSISDKSPQKNYHSTDDTEASEVPDTVETVKDENKITDDGLNLKVEIMENEEESNKVKEKKSEVDEQKLAKIQTIKKGWTEHSCESITLGEIYLMFGSDSKLILEYSWDDLPNHSLDNDDQNPKSNSEGLMENSPEDLYDGFTKIDVSESLSKLLSVAKLHYRKNIIKCPCGHVCGTKNNARLKKAVESKIRKILNDFDKCEDVEDKMTHEDETDSKFVVPPVYIPQKVRPISPATFLHQPSSQLHLVSQIDSIRRLKPRYCNRRGRRPRSKQVVVERKLPLLPNRVESDHQIVRMNIITQENAKLPISFGDQIQLEKGLENLPSTSLSSGNAIISSKTVLLKGSSVTQVINTDNTDGTSTINLELISENTNISSAPSSPSMILKEADDNQWITSEVADYSLSSLLGHLESPVKASSSSGASESTSLTSEDSRMSLGSQLISLLTESSVDFSANFADLAAQVTNDSRN